MEIFASLGRGIRCLKQSRQGSRQRYGGLGGYLRAVVLGALLLLVQSPFALGQDYRKACDLITQLKEGMASQNTLDLVEILKDLIPGPNSDYFYTLPKGATLNEELNFSECRVDYALMKKGNAADTSAPKVTVLFRGIPRGVWARYWVVENVFDELGNPLPSQGFQLESSSGNFTDLSKQVRDIASSEYLGLAPYGRLGRSYLAGREFRNDPYSTKLTFNNIQLLDSLGRLLGYVYVTMGYRGFPDEWYITEIGPMSQRWLGRDRYVDFLLGRIDSLSRLAPAPKPGTRPVLIPLTDTTMLQSVGDTTYFAESPTQFDTLYYQVAGERNAFSVGRSRQFLNMRMYPLDHSPDDSASGPRERGPLSIGMTLGLSRTFATVIKAYSAGNVYLSRDPSPYQGRTNVQVGVDARYQFLPKVSGGLNVGYQTWAYAYEDGSLLSDGGTSSSQWVFTQYSEQIHTLSFYAYGTYDLRKPASEGDEEPRKMNWVPYGELGVGYGLNVGSEAQLTETLTPGASGTDNDPQVRSLVYETNPYRMMPYVTPAAAVGLRLETLRSDFWVSLRFRPMTWNVVDYDDPNERSLVPLSQGFFKMDDDLGLNQFALTVGYAFVFKKKQ